MKKFAIIGGGISGLAVLHYLKKRFADTIDVTLYEANPSLGGTIASSDTQGFFFETGPNGFLTNQPNTLEFIEELGFSHEMIEANLASKRRYVQIAGQLHLLPMDPWNFFSTPLLSFQEKCRLIQGLSKKNISKDQSIDDYISQRFGVAVAKRLVDPFLTGVYAGDIKRLHMGVAFPKMGTAPGQVRAHMVSFRKGMGSLIEHLSLTYAAHIQTGAEIKSLNQVKADVIVCAAPAYVAARLFDIDILNRIYYAPVAVVGLLIAKSSFKTLPDGFGYLIPSSEKKEILGVLLESNVFPRYGSRDYMFIRVMLGGAHHPTFTRFKPEEILAKALTELDTIYGLKEKPLNSTVKIWPKGIPQYDLDYPRTRQLIKEELRTRPHQHLCANYLDGISFNDCIKNARQLVDSMVI